MPPLPAHNRKSISQAGAKGNVFFAHGLKIRSFQGVPESCRCQSRRGIPACMRRIGHRIVVPWVKTGLLHCRSDSCLRCGMRRMAAAPPDFPAWRSGRRAGADSPSAPGKQAKSAKGGRPAGGDRTPGRDASLPQKAGSDRKTLAQDTGREPSCRVARRMQGEPGTTLLSPARLQKRKEGPLSESLHLSDQSGMRITSWIYAHRAVRRAGPCCGSRYGRCRTGA